MENSRISRNSTPRDPLNGGLNIESSNSATSGLLLSPDLEVPASQDTSLSSGSLDEIFAIPGGTPHNLSQSQFAYYDNKGRHGETMSTSSVEPQLCQNTQGLCTTLAVDLMKSLHARPSACLFSIRDQDRDPRPIRAVDNILSTNQTAIRVVRGFISCLCYSNPRLQLQVSVICAETVEWYRAITRLYDHGTSTTPEGGPGFGNRLFVDQLPNQRCMKSPLSIGNYLLDGDLESSLVGQILFARLQELEDLVGSIVRHLPGCNTRRSLAAIGLGLNEATRNPAETALLEAIHSRLITHLRVQIDAARRDLASLPNFSTRSRAHG
ncbi:hypothetical protein F5Y06DRAFT_306976 [Hypoxylon sp. FL0890]|nr:hypothetical protein F5Y06DRAFT_306976 [Hypoxylon sp. FL0890]